MSKKFFFIVMILAAMSVNNLFAQIAVKKDSGVKRKQSFVFYTGGGLAGYTGSITSVSGILDGDISKMSTAGTFRVMWHPGYRLRLGLESGYTTFYSYKVKNGTAAGKVSLDAVPLLIVWAMPLTKRVEIFGGLGSYFLTTHLNYNGQVKSSTFSLGSNIALSYTQPLSKTLGLAAEAKWMNAFETKDDLISVQLLLVWKIFK
jgi:hypothetical protein